MSEATHPGRVHSVSWSVHVYFEQFIILPLLIFRYLDFSGQFKYAFHGLANIFIIFLLSGSIVFTLFFVVIIFFLLVSFFLLKCLFCFKNKKFFTLFNRDICFSQLFDVLQWLLLFLFFFIFTLILGGSAHMIFFPFFIYRYSFF